jgi:hypothetical protein
MQANQYSKVVNQAAFKCCIFAIIINIYTYLCILVDIITKQICVGGILAWKEKDDCTTEGCIVHVSDFLSEGRKKIKGQTKYGEYISNLFC